MKTDGQINSLMGWLIYWWLGWLPGTQTYVDIDMDVDVDVDI